MKNTRISFAGSHRIFPPPQGEKWVVRVMDSNGQRELTDPFAVDETNRLGYTWGYEGQGARRLAMAILGVLLGNAEDAIRYYPCVAARLYNFAWDLDWILPGSTVMEWVGEEIAQWEKQRMDGCNDELPR